MLHIYCIFTCILHNFCIFTCISAQVLHFSPVSFTISLFFTHVSAKLLYFHLCFSSIFLNPNIWKATVFFKYIPQPYFSTVFRNCILRVYFPTGRKLRMRGCEATDRAPGGYRLPGSGDRPLLEVGSGH